MYIYRALWLIGGWGNGVAFDIHAFYSSVVLLLVICRGAAKGNDLDRTTTYEVEREKDCPHLRL